MNTLSNPDRRGRRHGGSSLLVTLSVVVAFFIDLAPLPASLDLIRPDLTLLVLLFWSTRTYSPANVGTSWFAGLFKDIAMLTPLGLHAGVYCLGSWGGLMLRRRLEQLPLATEMVLVFVLLVLTFALQWSVGHLIDDRPLVEAELLSPLLGTLLWPLVRVLLAPLEQRLLPSSASD